MHCWWSYSTDLPRCPRATSAVPPRQNARRDLASASFSRNSCAPTIPMAVSTGPSPAMSGADAFAWRGQYRGPEDNRRCFEDRRSDALRYSLPFRFEDPGNRSSTGRIWQCVSVSKISLWLDSPATAPRRAETRDAQCLRRPLRPTHAGRRLPRSLRE